MGVVRPLMPLLSRKERISFRNYDLRRAALNELTFFSLCIFVRHRSATPCPLIGSALERPSITETRVKGSHFAYSGRRAMQMYFRFMQPDNMLGNRGKLGILWH